MMKRQYFSITTAADGSATVGASTTTAKASIIGELCAIKYAPGTIDTGATITVTCVSGDGSIKPMLTKASAGTSTLWFYPRDLVHAVADGAALTGTSGGDRTEPILDGQVKIVVASGGNGGIGSVTVYYE
jgi:hypothetical protein